MISSTNAMSTYRLPRVMGCAPCRSWPLLHKQSPRLVRYVASSGGAFVLQLPAAEARDLRRINGELRVLAAAAAAAAAKPRHV